MYPRSYTAIARARTLGIELLEARSLLAVASLAPDADTYVGGTSGAAAGSAAVLDLIGNPGGASDRTAYIRFDLGALRIEQVTSATVTFHKVTASRNDVINTARFDVYGLTDQTGNTLQTWSESGLSLAGLGAEFTNVGGDKIDVTRLHNLNQETGAAVTESIVDIIGGAISLSGDDLVAFLNARNAVDGLATLIVVVDADNGRGYGFGSRENADLALRPVLQITYDEAPPLPDGTPPRQMEQLDRGLIVLRRAANAAYIGWRMLGTDPTNIAFNIYRSAAGAAAIKLNAAPLTNTTDFVDTTANHSLSNTYTLRAVLEGAEQPASAIWTLAANSPIQSFLEVPLQIPMGGTVPDHENPGEFLTYTYSSNDASVGDVDGDGQYEILLKWDPSNSKDNSQSGYTGNVLLDAYRLDGTRLWRIDLGRNIRAGAHYTQFMVYDFDGDGRAEVAMKTAPGTIDGTGQAVSLAGDVATADYRNSSGYVLSGPEYLTVFDGLTGAALDTIPFEPARGTASEWGDSYGNRVDRFTAGVAYLDGTRPSLIMARGYYGPQSSSGQSRNELVAYDFRNGAITTRWHFRAGYNVNGDINHDYIGQGAHSLTIGDVDGDGRDEVIYGAAAIDDDGTGLYTTGLGHGDALHLSDMDPNRPGLEVFMVHESPSAYQSNGRDAGGGLRDAATGELLVQIPGDGDIGRGVAFDIDPNHAGYEFWATTDQGTRMVYNVSGEALYATPGNMFYNFGVWWDADPLRELLDGTTISDWNFTTASRTNIDLDLSTSGTQSAPNASSNNSTKSTPALLADILGDWREEVIWRRADDSALLIFSTTIAASSRLTTLMHDSQYRVAIAWQNGGYNQPPHPSFFLGAGMTTPPQPNIYYAGELRGDYNRDSVVSAADYTVWRDSQGTANFDADGNRDGVLSQADFTVWAANFGTASAAALLVAGGESPLPPAALLVKAISQDSPGWDAASQRSRPPASVRAAADVTRPAMAPLALRPVVESEWQGSGTADATRSIRPEHRDAALASLAVDRAVDVAAWRGRMGVSSRDW